MSTKLKLAAAILMAAIAPAHAGNAAEGQKISAQCAACHGEDGKTAKVPGSPVLAGQYEDYLVRALLDYQNGSRKNAIMAGIAKPLKRDEIRNLAAYFASLPGPLSHKR
jgi:cytochrome c553